MSYQINSANNMMIIRQEWPLCAYISAMFAHATRVQTYAFGFSCSFYVQYVKTAELSSFQRKKPEL